MYDMQHILPMTVTLDSLLPQPSSQPVVTALSLVVEDAGMVMDELTRNAPSMTSLLIKEPQVWVDWHCLGLFIHPVSDAAANVEPIRALCSYFGEYLILLIVSRKV